MLLFPLAPGAAAQEEGEGSGAQPAGPVVLVEEATPDSIRPSFEHPARIEAVQNATVRPIISAQITGIHFRGGDIVEEGDLLIEMDDINYQIALKEAEANLKEAEANVVKLDADLERAEQLVERATVSQRDLDFARAAADVGHAQVEVAKARLDAAKKNLSDTQVNAPFTGRISAPNYAVGDLFTPGDPTQLPSVATLVSLDPIYAVGIVDQANYFNFIARRLELQESGGSIPPLEMQVILPGGTVYEHDGKFENWDNTAAASSGTIAARVLFPNPDGLLLPGENVTVRGEVIEPIDTILVPQRAVSFDQVGHYVWVVGADGTAGRRDIKVGIRNGSSWTVREGLEAGDQVIVEGLQKVREGAPVTPEPWQG